MYCFRLSIIILVVSMVLLAGCSGGPTVPDTPQVENIQTQPEVNIDPLPVIENPGEMNHQLWGTWQAVIDTVTKTVSIEPFRDAEVHFNVTPYLPDIYITINSYNPVTGIVDVDVKIDSRVNLDGHDVRMIIYTDSCGHMLMNADDWTGLYDRSGGLPINPFKAYCKANPNRIFEKLKDYTENFQIYLPGGNPNVVFAIDASWPSNCEEPYEMNNFSHGDIYNQLDSSTTMQVDVYDWQSDVNGVYLYCPAVTGQTLVSFSPVSQNTWSGTLENKTNAQNTEYTGFLLAESFNSGTLYLYDKVTINIIHFYTPVPVITCTNPGGDPPYVIDSGDYIDVHGLDSSDEDGDIIKYEWDFDYDPVTEQFAEPTDPAYLLQDNPSSPTFGNPPERKFKNPTSVQQVKYIALRVTDNSIFSLQDLTYIEVQIGPNQFPVAAIRCTSPGGPPPYNIESGTWIDFDAYGSADPDGAITKYEWDFSYDNVSGIFADPSDPDYYTNANLPNAYNPAARYMVNLFDYSVSHYVALRVTDNSDDQVQVVTYVEVIIGPNKQPVAQLEVLFFNTSLNEPYIFYTGETAILRPGPATDDDGSIVTYQYDLSYDGVTFNVEEENQGGEISIGPLTESVFDVAFRVIDNGIPPKSDIVWKTITVPGPAAKTPVTVGGGSGVDIQNVGFHAIIAGSSSICCVWAQDGTGKDIYYSVSYNSGGSWSTPGVLNTTTTGNQQNASLAVDPRTDTYYAVFKDDSSGSIEISFAVSDPNCAGWQASMQGTIPSISTDIGNPSIAVNPSDGQMYVAYRAKLAGMNEIVVRTSSDLGQTWNTPSDGINDDNSSWRDSPSIAFDSTSNLVGIAWSDNRYVTSQRIFFNWSDASGTSFQADDIYVVPSMSGQTSPSLVNYNGTWMVCYYISGSPGDIYFSSSLNGTDWTLVSDCTDNLDTHHNYPTLCVDGDGTIYMSCRDIRETQWPLSADVYVFKSDDGGSRWTRGARVNKRSGGENSLHVNMAGLPGGFIVLYHSPQDLVKCVVSDAY